MDNKDYRYMLPPWCTLGATTGPQTIIVRQVVGEKEKQKAIDIHVVVPPQKPSIEQIVDVFVKDVEVTCVDIITDKVIVRGEFEVKAIYVACLPEQPVHAVELKHYRWSLDVDMPGVRRGMDADASVIVEFVDYDVCECTRAYKHKHYMMDDDECEEECKPQCKPVCKPICEPCGCCHEHEQEKPPCHQHKPEPCQEHHHHGNCHEHTHCHEIECTREFDVAVVLKVIAKVMTDREVVINQGATAAPQMPQMPPNYGMVPPQPKG